MIVIHLTTLICGDTDGDTCEDCSSGYTTEGPGNRMMVGIMMVMVPVMMAMMMMIMTVP